MSIHKFVVSRLLILFVWVLYKEKKKFGLDVFIDDNRLRESVLEDVHMHEWLAESRSVR